MGIKFFSIFIIFFLFASIFIFYQKSKTLVFAHSNPNKVLMEFKNIKSYDITYNGIIGKLQAKSAKKFKNKYVLYDINSSKNDNEQLRADKGVLKNDILNLFGNVFYKNNLDDRTLSSNTVIYNIKKDILSSKTPFRSTYDKSIMTGSSFIYFKKNKRLIAQNIKAEIHTEKK